MRMTCLRHGFLEAAVHARAGGAQQQAASQHDPAARTSFSFNQNDKRRHCILGSVEGLGGRVQRPRPETASSLSRKSIFFCGMNTLQLSSKCLA